MTQRSFIRAALWGLAGISAVGCGSPPADPGTSAADPVWSAAPDLPRSVANNAVVGMDLDGESHIYSFMGIDTTKRWDGVVSWAFRWVVGSNAWEDLPPVPGPGRLAGTAEVWGGKAYVFGGYTVAADGAEASVPNVDVFDPATGQWSAAAPMPVPVDDAISGVWRDSLIVLVSGWHDTDNVADVQIYDPSLDAWSTATSIPGAPVFGHAGKISGDGIVYLGGANTRGTRPRYQIEASAWTGRIAPSSRAIDWQRADAHPGPPLYRSASGSVEDWVVFAGGTDNPYNYDGNGYNGLPAVPLRSVFAYHVPTGQWVPGPALPQARMDHRALAVTQDHVVLVGGMDSQLAVSSQVFIAKVDSLVAALDAGLGSTR